MSRQIVLLRGVNVGSHKRIAMNDLRSAFEQAGFEDVLTYVQSGNVVLSGEATPDRCRRLLADALGVEVEVVVRTRSELAAVVQSNPLADVAADLKRYQVTFLAAKPQASVVERLAALATDRECFAAHGRELYAWYPGGAARSKLWNAIAGKDLGVVATSRNWSTVTKLLELAGG